LILQTPNVVSFVTLGGLLFNIPCGANPYFTLNHHVSVDSKIDVLASLRGKVGWSFARNWLIYGTGGAAALNRTGCGSNFSGTFGVCDHPTSVQHERAGSRIIM
jgi:hypothetical protein